MKAHTNPLGFTTAARRGITAIPLLMFSLCLATSCSAEMVFDEAAGGLKLFKESSDVSSTNKQLLEHITQVKASLGRFWDAEADPILALLTDTQSVPYLCNVLQTEIKDFTGEKLKEALALEGRANENWKQVVIPIVKNDLVMAVDNLTVGEGETTAEPLRDNTAENSMNTQLARLGVLPQICIRGVCIDVAEVLTKCVIPPLPESKFESQKQLYYACKVEIQETESSPNVTLIKALSMYAPMTVSGGPSPYTVVGGMAMAVDVPLYAAIRSQYMPQKERNALRCPQECIGFEGKLAFKVFPPPADEALVEELTYTAEGKESAEGWNAICFSQIELVAGTVALTIQTKQEKGTAENILTNVLQSVFTRVLERNISAQHDLPIVDGVKFKEWYDTSVHGITLTQA